jgi:hypothetical protein
VTDCQKIYISDTSEAMTILKGWKEKSQTSYSKRDL